GADELQGGADDEVAAGGDRTQVQALEDDGAGLEEGEVHFVGGGMELLDRQVVDADELDSAIGEQAAGVRGEADEVAVEGVVVPETAVGGLDQEAEGVRRQAGGFEIGGGDVRGCVVFDDLRRADKGVQR